MKSFFGGVSWGVVCAAVVCGCSEDPEAFVGEDATVRETGVKRDSTEGETLTDGAEGTDGGDDRNDSGRDAGQSGSGVRPCRANGECGSPGLYCNGPGCGSVGFCVPRAVEGECEGEAGGDDSGTEQVCGCDAVTYGSLCEIHRAGVRLRAFGACARD